ncbi:hypothetical protein [Thiolapillus sp.]|uniref:hypothetical protein n=1 Tax=Thiolapillus sp. TaxID=2017437 RepID=UPI003AF574A0
MSIADYFLKLKKRPRPSASSESDPETPQTSRTQDRKRPHTTEQVEEGEEDDSMTTQEMLSNICQRMDALATKDDIVKIQNDIQALRRTVSENIEVLEGRVFEVEAKNDQLQKEIGALKKENQTMKDTLNLQDRKIKRTEKEQNSLQQYSRRWNLRVYKVPEREKETSDDCIRKCCDIFSEKVAVAINKSDIEVAHRSGPTSSTNPRPILVRFFDRKKRDEILSNRRRLKGKGVVIGEDMTPATYKIYRDASKHSARANVWTSNGTVIAKLKNGRTLKLDIHTNVNDAFRRAMAGHENIEEVELLDSSNA